MRDLKKWRFISIRCLLVVNEELYVLGHFPYGTEEPNAIPIRFLFVMPTQDVFWWIVTKTPMQMCCESR